MLLQGRVGAEDVADRCQRQAHPLWYNGRPRLRAPLTWLPRRRPTLIAGIRMTVRVTGGRRGVRGRAEPPHGTVLHHLLQQHRFPGAERHPGVHTDRTTLTRVGHSREEAPTSTLTGAGGIAAGHEDQDSGAPSGAANSILQEQSTDPVAVSGAIIFFVFGLISAISAATQLLGETGTDRWEIYVLDVMNQVL